jgi:hypothetical protein
MRRSFVKGLTVGALLVAAALSATTVLAGSGVGGVFNLGRTNKVGRTTVLTGKVASTNLQVVNKGTVTALTLNVQPGAAPMSVNSSVTVSNLSAYMIDGIDSSALLQGTGQVVQNRITEGLSSGNENILNIPGWGTIEASCGASGVPNYRLYWRNGQSGATTDVWWSDGTVTSGVLATYYTSLGPNAGTYVAPVDQAIDRIVRITSTFSSGGNTHTVNVTTSAHTSASGCVFSAQAIDQ